MKNKINELKDAKDRVANLLENWPNLRNSDAALIGAYYSIYHNTYTTTNITYLISLGEAPSYETIRRTRQRLQREGLYMSDKQVACWRRENEVDVRRELSNAE